VQKIEQCPPVGGRETGEVVSRRQSLPAMPQAYIVKGYASSIVTIGRRSSNAPQRHRQHLRPERSVIVDFVEVRSQVVTLEVGEDVFDKKIVEVRFLQCGESSSVVDLEELGGGGGEHPVEWISSKRIEHRFHVRNS